MPPAESSQQNDEQNVNESMSTEYRMEDLETYEAMLRDAVVINSDEIFPNADKHHAAVAMSVLFENTYGTVCMLVDSFTGKVSDNPKYIEGLTKCLDRGTSFRILTINDVNEDSAGYKLLMERKRDEKNKVEIAKVSEAALQTINSGLMKGNIDLGETYNFALFDNNKYRLEILPSKYMALLSFNDVEFVSKYSKVFETAFRQSMS